MIEETVFQRRRRQRRETVAGMVTAGASVAGMADALGVTAATIRADMKALGVGVVRGGRVARYEAALRSIAEGCLDAAELARATLEGR